MKAHSVTRIPSPARAATAIPQARPRLAFRLSPPPTTGSKVGEMPPPLVPPMPMKEPGMKYHVEKMTKVAPVLSY